MNDEFEEAHSRGGTLPLADLERGAFIRDHIPDGVQTILDVGCGMGQITKILGETHDVTGLELSHVAVEKAAKLGVAVVPGGIDKLPFPDGSFDLVMGAEVLEHLDEELFAKGVREIARVAAQFVLLTLPNRDRLQALRQECPNCRSILVPWGHIRSFDVEYARHLFDDLGFSSQQVELFGPLITNNHKLLCRLLRSHRWFRNRLHPGNQCPVCKYVERAPAIRKPNLGDFFARPAFTLSHVLDYVALKLSPKCRRWILAVYKTDGNCVHSSL